MNIHNHLEETRLKRGLSVASLARQAGVQRQTIYAIESGTYIPNTVVALKLAQILEVSVEDLFSIEGQRQALSPEECVDLLLPSPGEKLYPNQPVRVGRVGKQRVGVPSSLFPTSLPGADGVVCKVDRAHRATVRRWDAEGNDSQKIILAGCDPGMSVLARHLSRTHNFELIIAGCSSSQALRWLKQKKVHLAGTHLRDETTGESNLPILRKIFPRGGYRVITFASWEEGLVVARGNPMKIRAAKDWDREGLKWVNREPGAGSRFLFDSILKKQGIPSQAIRGYDRIAYGHLPAAWRVYSGEADICIAVRAAAQVFGLGFVPLQSERYDLVIPEAIFDLQPLQMLLDVMNRSALKRELEALGGYDTSQTGRFII
ncbi:MAG: substrate-binding domain-containing protein [Terriglobia bacterium]